MTSGLFIAVIAGLGGMLGWGFADFFAKKTIDLVGDVVSLAWGHIFGTGILLLFTFYEFVLRGRTVFFPSNPLSWLGLVFFGVLQAAVYLLVYKGFSKGQLVILNPIFSSFSGIVALISILIFGEIITGSIVFALITIFIGVMLLSLDIDALKNGKVNFRNILGFKEVGLATLLAAVWTISWGKFVLGNDWLAYALCMYASMTIAILIFCKFKGVSILGKKTKKIWFSLFFIGFCETIAYLAISLGYSDTRHLSVIALLSGGFSLPTIILARIFLKEKISRFQLLGGLIIVAGIMFLSF